MIYRRYTTQKINDDTLCAGDKEALIEFKEEFKKHFSIKEEGEMK